MILDQEIPSTMDLTLDITSGCQFSCTGCTVDKTGSEYPDDDTFKRLAEFVTTMRLNGVAPTDLTLGPTDITTATGGIDILFDPKFHLITHQFKTLTVNTSCLHPSDEVFMRMAEGLEVAIPGGNVKLITPVEFRHLNNQKYLDKLRDRIRFIESKLKSTTLSQVYASFIFDDREDDKNEYTVELMETAYTTSIHPKTHADVAFPHGRLSGERITNREHLKRSIAWFNSLAANTKKGKGPKTALEELKMGEGNVVDLMYRNGHLFWVAFVGEPTIVIDKSFKVEPPWTYTSIEDQYIQRLIQGYNASMARSPCNSCEYLNHCVSGWVPQIMDYTHATTCLFTERQ